MAPWRRLSVALLLLSLASTAVAAPRRVLVLHSFGRGFEPFTRFASAFRTELAETSPDPIEFHEITLETALFAGAESEMPFAEYLSAFDATRPLDLVVATGGSAINFVQRNRERLFRSTPVLFAGVDARHIARYPLTANDATAPMGLDLPGMLDNILQVLPDTTSVMVVVGRSPLEQFWAAELRRELEPYAGRLALTFTDDLPLRDILERAAALPPHSAILYRLFVVDAAGVPHEQERSLADLCAVAHAPVFGFYEHQLGGGIVGGPLLSVDGLARDAAAAARRILAGEPPSSIRLPPYVAGAPQFDSRQLVRWHIDPDRLPPGSRILFREPTFWERYKWGIVGIGTIGGAQAALILLLLTNLKGRKRAEQGLRKSREQYALAVDGSTDGLWDWDVPSGDVFLSARGREILGYDDGEPVRDIASWDGRVHAEDRERVAAALRAHVEGRTPGFDVECRLIGDERGERWILSRGKAQRDAEGRAYRVAGSLTDVSDRKRAEQAVRDVSRRLIVVQEEERARLARELHDDVTQRLARLAIDAGRVEQESPDAAAVEAMRGVREGLAHLSEDVHELSYRLHPSLVEVLGLADALQAECERFSRQTALPVDVRLRQLPAPVPAGVSLCLFRIAQEALRNIGRHAKASSVDVTLQAFDGGVQLAVHDDGVGFDAASRNGPPSLGHASMRERVQLVGGEIDIESAPGQGTTILAWVPLAKEGP